MVSPPRMTMIPLLLVLLIVAAAPIHPSLAVRPLLPTTTTINRPHSAKSLIVNADCQGANQTVYVRTESFLVEDAPAATLLSLTLNECAKKCTSGVQGIKCRSFEYNSQTQSCALKTAQGQPFGRSVLHPTQQPGIAFFQKICIPSDELCSAPYTFERFPQHVLSGHAMEVISADNLSDCLLKCLESRKRLKLDCKSAMYYYETGQCILNREIRRSAPELFSNDTRLKLVDYFESACFDVSCFGSAQLHWMRSEEFHIDPERDILLTGLSLDGCKQACVNNKAGEETFPCRAFVYSSTKKECQLSADSGIVRKETTKGKREAIHSEELSTLSGKNYWEKVCLAGPVRCKESAFEVTPNRRLNARDRVISTPSLSRCLNQCLLHNNDCTSVQFDRQKDECILNKKSQFSHPELFHPSPSVDYYDNLCDVVEGSSDSSSSGEEESESGEEVDKEDSSTPQSITSGEGRSAEMRFRRIEGDSPSTTSTTPTPTSTRKPKPRFTSKDGPRLDTECRLTGIQIKATFPRPTTGSLFIKDHSGSCSESFEGASQALLHLPFPSSTHTNRRCPGVELAPNIWSFFLVLQMNGIGIASLMTGDDRIFNITCDFTRMMMAAGEQPPPTRLPLKEDEALAAATASAVVQMSIFRHGRPVTTVALGEELELRWTATMQKKAHKIIAEVDDEGVADNVVAVNKGEGETRRKEVRKRRKKVKKVKRAKDSPFTSFGFFVDSCTAERLDGTPPDPPPLPLIVNGCPDARVRHQLMRSPIAEISGGFNTTMKAFRFDGSRRVRIRCSVNICVERCAPVSCTFGMDGSGGGGGEEKQQRQQWSFGRRRRRQTIGELADLMERYDRVRSDILKKRLGRNGAGAEADVQQSTTVSGSYTIMGEGNGGVGVEDGQLEDTLMRDMIIPHSNTSVAVGEDGPSTIVEMERGGERSSEEHSTTSFHQLMGLSKMKRDEPPPSPPIDDPASCPSNQNPNVSTLCLQRRLFILMIVGLIFLSTVQSFYFIRLVHKKCGGGGAEDDGRRSLQSEVSAASYSRCGFMHTMQNMRSIQDGPKLNSPPGCYNSDFPPMSGSPRRSQQRL